MSMMSRLRDNLPTIGFFSSIPAGFIDRLYLEEPKSFLGRATQAIKIRASYLLFAVLTPIDFVFSSILALAYAVRSLFTSETTQDLRLMQQKKYASQAGKSFYAFLASPIGIFFPKLVVFYFTPEQKPSSGVTAGGDLLHAPNAVLKKPTTREELQTIILEAIVNGDQIIPKGAGRSQGRQFLPEGNKKLIVIDLCEFKEITNVNPDDKTATIGAGVLWSELQTEANKHKMSVKVMQASNVFSGGGSFGTNIHGWDYHSGMISNTIRSMDIINAQGEFQTLTPQDNLFHLITGGLGLYGIVYRVNIELADNDLLERQAINKKPEEYADYFNQELKDNQDVKLHLYRLSLDPKNLLGEGFTETYVTTNKPAQVTPNFSTEPSQGTRTQRVLVNIARRFGWARKLWWNGERADFLKNNPQATRNEIMQAPINAVFNPSVSESEWLQEYFLPGDKLSTFIKEFGKLLMDNDVALLNATVRFVKQNNKSPLSYAHDGDRFAVVICFNQPLTESAIIHATKWLRQAQEMAVNMGGSYYLPYQDVSNPEVFKKSYPGWQQAQAAKELIDPKQVFTSGLHQKYMVAAPEINHAKIIMDDANNKKSFEGFLTSVLKRVDVDKIYDLLEDILSYKDTHADIYQELCKRLPEIMPSGLDDFGRKLKSLYAIKQELSEQARLLLPDNLKRIDGIVEIGSPGRFMGGFKEKYKVTGKMVAVNDDDPSYIGDCINSGSFHPYDEFKRLDYTNSELNLRALEDNSADLITCYVGLHHFKPEVLDSFLKDIRRVLRTGGHFLLDDHDVVVGEASESMAHLAHMIFNAVNGVSLDNELNEIRDFKPMSHWIDTLAKYDLMGIEDRANVNLIRAGDPTLNRMIMTTKVSPKPVAANHDDHDDEVTEDYSETWRETGVKSSVSQFSIFAKLNPPNLPTDDLKHDSSNSPKN